MQHLKFNLPTPKTLDEAVTHALHFGPLNQVQERSYHVLRDFMAQKFGAAYLRADGEQLKLLQNLFEQLTKRSI